MRSNLSALSTSQVTVLLFFETLPEELLLLCMQEQADAEELVQNNSSLRFLPASANSKEINVGAAGMMHGKENAGAEKHEYLYLG